MSRMIPYKSLHLASGPKIRKKVARDQSSNSVKKLQDIDINLIYE